MKWVLRIVGGIILIAVIAVGSLFLIPQERLGQIAAEQISTATGRDVEVGGDVSLTLWPVLGLTVADVRISNAPWSDLGPMFETQRASVGVDAASLLSGTIEILQIEADSPTVRLEQLADGRASWMFGETGPAATEPGGTGAAPETAPDFSLNTLDVRNATFVYAQEGAAPVTLAGIDVRLDWPTRDAPVAVQATVRPAGQAVGIEARIERPMDLLAGSVQPVGVVVTAAEGQATFDGRMALSGDLAGQLILNLPNTDAFFAALDLPAPGLPQSLGARVSAQTEVTVTSDMQVALRDMSVDLGGNRLTGAVDVALADIPEVNAQIDAGDLDLSSLSSGGETGGGRSTSAPAPQSSGWSTAPIDASGLSAFNGNIAFSARSIDLGDLRLGATRVLMRNDRSRMVFDLQDVRAYDGLVTGEFVVNNRSGLSVGGQLNAASIGLQPLLRDAVDVDRLTGSADFQMAFLGVGQSMDAIMRSLSGDGNLSIGRGTIEGIDLDRLMRSGDGSGGTTIFDRLTASFNMQDGNVFNEDLLLALRRFEARGAGRIGLGGQDIDYLFTPIALEVNDGQGLAIPIRIEGPWSGPRIVPDLERALDLNLEAEKERLQNQVKQELDQAETKLRESLEQKVTEEVGGAAQGQSLEEAVKDKVENELKKGLRSLFD